MGNRWGDRLTAEGHDVDVGCLKAESLNGIFIINF